MEPIYVTGHLNPDTDSIVAAIAGACDIFVYYDRTNIPILKIHTITFF